MSTTNTNTEAVFPRAYTRIYKTWPKSSAPPAALPDADTEVEVAVEEAVDALWRVILYNDAVHTFDEVISQLIKATGCSSADAERVAWTVHTQGKANAYEGTFEECFRVQSVLREIELITEIAG